ncbi:rhodanese-like domain-containing protein [Labilibaculum sp.]|uniref:rhodanese-like domain-containing protein n=1 Tax=Labilibaculum sp. TaxID=2060723 RepID=UPI003563FD9C
MVFFQNNNNGPKTSYTALELMSELQKRDDIILVDIREPQELAKKGIANAMHISEDEMNDKLPLLPKDKDIVIFDHLGFRSKQVRNYMHKIGYHRTAHLKGGLNSWNEELKKQQNQVSEME